MMVGVAGVGSGGRCLGGEEGRLHRSRGLYGGDAGLPSSASGKKISAKTLPRNCGQLKRAAWSMEG